ncbi:MAG: ion transporter [Cytophagales bacterium]|nr:MAG: ion transporter [Cytophagales bacterium]
MLRIAQNDLSFSSKNNKMNTKVTFKYKLYQILRESDEAADEYRLMSRRFDFFMLTLIFLNLIAFTISTVEYFQVRIGLFLDIFELCSLIIFTLEYFAHLWCITEDEKFSHPLRGRIHYALTWIAIIDLVAFLPALLIYVYADLSIFTTFRLFRLLKLWRYSNALKTLGRIINSKKADLQIVFFTIVILLIISSSLMFYIEHDAQREAYSSIPQTMWWAIITLTTVGYGDVYPITPLGKSLGAFVALLGVCLIALPAGIISAGFIQEFESQKENKFLGETIAKLINAFNRSNQKVGSIPAKRRFIDVMTATSQLELSEQDIFQAVRSHRAGLRVRYKKNDIKARFASILVIEYFDFNTLYGTFYQRNSPYAIIAPMSYVDHFAGHFSVHLSHYLNTNYMSNEMFGEEDTLNFEAAFCFTENDAYQQTPDDWALMENPPPKAFIDFRNDLHDIVSMNSTVIILRTNPSNLGDFHISFGAMMMEDGSTDATFGDVEKVNKFYQEFKKRMEKEGFKYSYAAHQQYDPFSTKHLKHYLWYTRQANIVEICIDSDILEVIDVKLYYKLITILGDCIKQYLF